MGLNRYILTSVFFHFTLLSLLTITYHVQKGDVSVFDVKIVEPPEIQPLQSSKQNVTEKAKTETKKKITQAKNYSAPELDKISKPPDTLYGEDIESIQPSDKVEEFRSPSVTEDNKTSSGNEESWASPSGDIKLDPYTFLFDRETIEKFARRTPNDTRGLTFDAPEFKHRGYMRMLKQRIESIWAYPEEAVRQGISGDLYIKFSIKRDGRLGNVELIRTSGYRNLDEAAMKAIRDAQPFWPLPEDWQKDDLVINGHFIYILGETLVM